MRGQADYESAWIAWVRSVISAEGRLRRCTVCQEHGDTPFDRILWPGFIGKRYADGGVLLAGAMHNAKQLRTSEMEELAEFVEHWATATPSDALDAELLARTRSAYITSARRVWIRTGQVWGLFRDILAQLGMPDAWDQVAFTNWCKCMAPSGSPEYAAHLQATEPNGTRFPLEIGPRAIFICCGDSRLVAKIAQQGIDAPIVRAFDQPRSYNRFQPPSKFPDNLPFSQWLSEDIAKFDQFRRSS